MNYNFVDLPTENHWCQHNLKLHIYEDICSIKELQDLKKAVANLYSNNHINYMIHGTSIILNNKSIHLGASASSNRYQEIPFDWTYSKYWVKQTPKTIKKFTDEQLLKHVDPKFIKIVKKFENYPPYCDEKNKWICYRMHINILEYDQFLSPHTDGAEYMLNKSIKNANMFSTTFYLWNHIENEGGEFYTIDGFVYKPKENSAISLNGHQVIHGVTQNKSKSKKARLAFTTRWIHADDILFECQKDTRIVYSLPLSYD